MSSFIAFLQCECERPAGSHRRNIQRPSFPCPFDSVCSMNENYRMGTILYRWVGHSRFCLLEGRRTLSEGKIFLIHQPPGEEMLRNYDVDVPFVAFCGDEDELYSEK